MVFLVNSVPLVKLSFTELLCASIVISHGREILLYGSTAVDQVEACASVMQRAQVRFPVGTSFLGEVFSGFFLTCKTYVRKL